MSHSQQICRFLKYDKIWQKRSVCVQIGLFRTESIIYVLWNYSQFFIMIENLFSGCVFLCTCYDGFLFECFFFLQMLCSIFERFWLNCEHWICSTGDFTFPGLPMKPAVLWWPLNLWLDRASSAGDASPFFRLCCDPPPPPPPRDVEKGFAENDKLSLGRQTMEYKSRQKGK